jgi:hypothetical protein
MPWHVATLKGRNKYRGGDGERGRKKRIIDKEKIEGWDPHAEKAPLRMTPSVSDEDPHGFEKRILRMTLAASDEILRVQKTSQCLFISTLLFYPVHGSLLTIH